MNRRNFLKSLGVVCGAAIAAPITLLNGKPRHLWMRGKDGSSIEGESTDRWPKYHGRIPHHTGLTHEQLCELLKMTLKDMPKMPPTYWQDIMDAKLAGRPLL